MLSLNRIASRIILLSLAVVLTSCGPTTFVFIETESDATPLPEQQPQDAIIEEPTQNDPSADTPGELLEVTWDIIPKCINGNLKEATIKLIISGGKSPFKLSPAKEFSLSAGDIQEIKVTSSDDQTWTGKVQAPKDCGEANSENVVVEVTVNPSVYGCTDPAATNYNPSATINDGSCTYPVYGCTDPAATNYNPSATIDDGSCEYPVYGCTDPTATNYDPSATIDDGSCQYPPPHHRACNNGRDDDNDGFIDGADPQCDNNGDDDESQ